MEQKVKQVLGEQLFSLIALQSQLEEAQKALEEAQKKIKELEANAS